MTIAISGHWHYSRDFLNIIFIFSLIMQLWSHLKYNQQFYNRKEKASGYTCILITVYLKLWFISSQPWIHNKLKLPLILLTHWLMCSKWSWKRDIQGMINLMEVSKKWYCCIEIIWILLRTHMKCSKKASFLRLIHNFWTQKTEFSSWRDFDLYALVGKSQRCSLNQQAKEKSAQKGKPLFHKTAPWVW